MWNKKEENDTQKKLEQVLYCESKDLLGIGPGNYLTNLILRNLTLTIKID